MKGVCAFGVSPLPPFMNKEKRLKLAYLKMNMEQPGVLTLDDPQVQGIIQEKQAQVFFDGQWQSGSKGKKLPATQIMSTDMWKGKRCFVVGGGPSLKGFDFKMLEDEYSIAVNRAYEFYDADILFAMDGRFYNWTIQGNYGKEAKKRFYSFNGIKFWLDIANLNINHVHYVKAIGRSGLSWQLEHGLFHGNNSGFGALNLALTLGANPIYLLGFDMAFNKKGEGHFHDGHPVPFKEAMMKSFPINFVKYAAQMKAHGRRVINCNRKSALKCFEFGDLPENTGKNKRIVFVSFYTRNGYEKVIDNLRQDCWRYSLRTDFEEIPNQGSWIKNVQYKPVFMKRMLQKHAGHSIVWVDADARIREYPKLFNKIKADIGVHYRKKGKGDVYREELLSGTIYLANNERTLNLMDLWIRSNRDNPKEWDQRTLAKVINSNGCIVQKIPAPYCQIFDTMKGEGGNPVIEHFQASRQLKRS